MLQNTAARENLTSLARQKGRDYVTKTINPKLLDDALAQGWTIDRENKQSVRLRRAKPHGTLLEDRVWSMLYRMNFASLSAEGGATLVLNSKEQDSPKNQIDVLAMDPEVVTAIECKSAEKVSRRPQFQEELAKHSIIRTALSQAVRTQFPTPVNRQVVLAMFLSNVSLSDNDVARAKNERVALFDQSDLAYYETLAAHLGPAAKYQLLADMLPGKSIPGLEIRVAAVKTKMGGTHCYTFSMSPEYLLKISYVSHRSKGKASDVDTYQRMLKKSRLNAIREYIREDGIFPTNIVVNIDDKRRLQFDRISQDKSDQENGVLGWLSIRPSYKCAWIIDGQHRLYAYSGHERAAKSRVSVLAFEGLPPSEQARLFIDINAKQKRVKQSLLQELDAELHWDADDPSDRVRAIVSKAVQILDADPESPLYQRIQKADDAKDAIRCISLTSVYSAMMKTGFHIVKEKKGQVLEYGPLWAGGNDATLRRTVCSLKGWLSLVRSLASDWWDKGSGDGGGLAMNDGVTTCLNVLRSVFQHIDSQGTRLIHLDDEDLCDCVKGYGEALGRYFASLSEQERKRFRDLRGIQGQTARTRRCQKAVQQTFPSFNPAGLDEFLEREKAQTNIRAKEVIDRIERTLQRVVLEELRQECGTEDTQWWIVGVPKGVRKKVTQKLEEDDGKRGGKECYLDLIDYKHIAVQNWPLFEPLLAFGDKGNKEKRLSWMDFVNEKRNIVSHASSAVTLSIEELNELQQYERKLSVQTGLGEGGEDIDS